MTAVGHEMSVKQDDQYDSGVNSGNYMTGNCDIFNRINAILDNSLDLNNLAAYNNDQTKHAFAQIPMIPGPHSRQGMNHGTNTGYHDNQYNNAGTYQGLPWENQYYTS